MINKEVPLERKFSLISRDAEKSSESDFSNFFGRNNAITWKDLVAEYRVVILADAGAGKTFEMHSQAQVMSNQGLSAFFIRIEDIDSDFAHAFDVGTKEQFEDWLFSSEEAWFFLDSVDEALLVNPRSFEKAVKRFSDHIKKAIHRAHIYISSRPYAWRFSADRTLVESLLPYCKPAIYEDVSDGWEITSTVKNTRESDSSLKVYMLTPLDISDIRQFAHCCLTENVEQLVTEIERKNLMAMASRPFDLDGMLIKWKTDLQLGSRLELMRHAIACRLKEINPLRERNQPISQDKARSGARLLAAAVTFSGEGGISVPDSSQEKSGICAASILKSWSPNEIQALLDLGIFNDVIYRAVRFRHREIRELLTAEWLLSLLNEGQSRQTIESLIFQEKYGEKVITPRLRPVLSWLILFDPEIRERALKLDPNIAIEGGDISQLPVTDRRRILVDIVDQIAVDEDGRTARDNAAIARIAQPDLSDVTLQLIKKYKENDDVIFFLGRLVWQGNLTICLAELTDIALNPKRGIYARIASIRAVFTVGNSEQKIALWLSLLSLPEVVPEDLLSEILGGVASNELSIELLLMSIGRLPPHDKYNIHLLRHSILNFIKDVAGSTDSGRLLAMLVDGFHNYLKCEPHVEGVECQISTEYIWLVSPALNVVEQLIKQRAAESFRTSVSYILSNQPSLRFWHDSETAEFQGSLNDWIPQWPEFNDYLFWDCVAKERIKVSIKNEPLNDVWAVLWIEPFFKFNADSFDRIIEFIKDKPLHDDKLVALTLAVRLYNQSDKPQLWLGKLEGATTDDHSLQATLHQRLYPIPTEAQLKREEDQRQYKLKREIIAKRKERNRELWILRLRDNPDAVRASPNLAAHEFSSDQYWLLEELRRSSKQVNRTQYVNWRLLIEEFGEDVAKAFRDAAINFWRNFRPELGSEGGNTRTYPWDLVFAMTGLEIEAEEDNRFPTNLTDLEVNHSLRYITWELNGFPSWLEAMYKAYPEKVFGAIWTELKWELENTTSDNSLHYILHDLVFYAPWIHERLGLELLNYLRIHIVSNIDCLRYCIRLLSTIDHLRTELLVLARGNVAIYDSVEKQSPWYALWVGLDPESGIPGLNDWFQNKAPEDATLASQLFVAALMGDRRNGVSIFELNRACWSVNSIKSLYTLMCQNIRVEDDINRAGKGVYSPELRDDAQDARDALFRKLTELSGKETYIALVELSKSHPVVSYRAWMARCAKSHVIREADLQPWSEEQVYLLDSEQRLKPVNHHQLYQIGLLNLIELKLWLENGNDSLAKIFSRAINENEMRAILARELRLICKGAYTVGEEQPLANEQRPDIWLQHGQIKSSVPIELKLLDKNWTGPALCERLRNQLAGDYLRDAPDGCGIFLLVWQGNKSNRRWKIGNRFADLEHLSEALRNYWQGIFAQFPKVSDIEIVVIDLSKRAYFSAI